MKIRNARDEAGRPLYTTRGPGGVRLDRRPPIVRSKVQGSFRNCSSWGSIFSRYRPLIRY